MVSSSYLPSTSLVFSHLNPLTVSEKFRNSQKNLNIFFSKKPPTSAFSSNSLPSSSSSQSRPLQNSVPLVTSLAILLWSNPVNAGILSGFPGLESIPGPQLPEIEFLNRFNEENQKKYSEFDERFKSSPLLKQLLERSKLNKEKNKQEILDKYCIRGAEWGVGDCSAEGMTTEEKENFISMLKEKAGIK